MSKVIITCVGCGGEIELLNNKFVNIIGSPICSFSNHDDELADHRPVV
jgi:hypothetical protein